jgi:hypothetical protein
MRIAIVLAFLCAAQCAVGSGVRAAETPVASLAGAMYVLHTSAGDAAIPIDASASFDATHPEITRAVVIVHGKGRDEPGYFRDLRRAADRARQTGTTLLVAPQFLIEQDIRAHGLPNDVLRWHANSWSAGFPAVSPFPLSTFDVIDALLRRLADRATFPNLKTVVLFGHSAGGQFLNRYAIVGDGPETLETEGIHVRFVIANPSSYFYFSDDRPKTDGSFAPFDGASCPAFDHWRYGPEDAPPYVRYTSREAWAARESRYAAADVVYLLGTSDTDPAQADLDTTCAGEAQGAERFDRGKAYVRYLEGRHPADISARLWFVPDVGHEGRKMIESECGVAALFDSGTCATTAGSGLR